MNNFMPVVTLSNGLRVGNFCSGHPFVFTDNTTLPACSAKRVEASKLSPVTVDTQRWHKGVNWSDVELRFRLTSRLLDMLEQAFAQWRMDDIYIVLVPFPLMRAMKEHIPVEGDAFIRDFQQRPAAYPFRVIRRDGREGDGKGEGHVHIDRFCV